MSPSPERLASTSPPSHLRRRSQAIFVFRDGPLPPHYPRPDPPHPIPAPDPDPPMEMTTTTTTTTTTESKPATNQHGSTTPAPPSPTPSQPQKPAIPPPAETNPPLAGDKPISKATLSDPPLTPPPDSPRARPSVPFPAGGPPAPGSGTRPHSHAVEVETSTKPTHLKIDSADVNILLRKLLRGRTGSDPGLAATATTAFAGPGSQSGFAAAGVSGSG